MAANDDRLYTPSKAPRRIDRKADILSQPSAIACPVWPYVKVTTDRRAILDVLVYTGFRHGVRCRG